MEASAKSNISVATALPLLKNSPATAGSIAKTRGDECQILDSSASTASMFLLSVERRVLSAEDRNEYRVSERSESTELVRGRAVGA